jgi:hypothetical protein
LHEASDQRAESRRGGGEAELNIDVTADLSGTELNGGGRRAGII